MNLYPSIGVFCIQSSFLGGGAITCPPSSVTGGAPSRNLHQQLPSSNNNNVASTTYSSSPSPSPPIKSSESSATQAMAHSSETGGSSSSNSNSRVPCELSPPKFPAPSQDHSCYGYSVPPPVPARQPVTSTASNPPSAGRPSSPIVAPPQVAKPFASSSPAVLRTILPPKSDCNSLTPSSQQSPIPSPSVGGGPFGGTVLPSSTTYCSSSNSGGAAAATSSTIAMQPPATVSICTTSSSCPQIGPFTSPFSSPLQTVHAQSSSLPNSPNIIRVVSSPITSPPNPPNFVVPAHSSASSITTSIGTACSSVASSYNTNPRAGLASLAGSASAGATPVVGIRSAIMCPPPPPSGGKPSVPPRSPSSWWFSSLTRILSSGAVQHWNSSVVTSFISLISCIATSIDLFHRFKPTLPFTHVFWLLSATYEMKLCSLVLSFCNCVAHACGYGVRTIHSMLLLHVSIILNNVDVAVLKFISSHRPFLITLQRCPWSNCPLSSMLKHLKLPLNCRFCCLLVPSLKRSNYIALSIISTNLSHKFFRRLFDSMKNWHPCCDI